MGTNLEKFPLRAFLFIFTLAAVSSVTLLWPGDAPFINDEPKLFLAAYNANENGQLAETGLYGSVGLPYGPLPTWFYQGVLLITTNPEGWVLLRVLAMLFLSIAGMWLMAESLSLWKFFIPITLASPYFWYFSRHMWDNSFLIPLSVIALGSYAWFLSRNSRAALFLSFTAAVSLPLIHFMALPLSVILLCHMIIFSRKALWSLRFYLVGFVMLVLVSHWSYFNTLLHDINRFKPHAAYNDAQFFIVPFHDTGR